MKRQPVDELRPFEDPSVRKTCARCLKKKPSTRKYFRGRPKGLESICIECGGVNRNPTNPQVFTAIAKGGKICTACKRRLRHECFCVNRAMRDGLAPICGDCMYLQNTYGTPHIFVQEGPPIAMAQYREIVLGREHGVNAGRRVLQRIEQEVYI